jgi:hypothetical protein
LHGIFLIDDISGTGILAGSGYDELAGIFDITVTNLTVGVDGFGNPSYAYTFGATSSFATDNGFVANTTMAWYTDPTHEFARETNSGQTTTDLQNLITDGTLLWTTGLTGSAFWNALTATNDIAAISAGNIGGGQFVMGLNFTQNLSGLTFGQVSCINAALPGSVQVDQCANGNILTPNTQSGFTTPYDVWDDVNFNMNRTTVPEPEIIVSLGLGLLAMAASRRRKLSK